MFHLKFTIIFLIIICFIPRYILSDSAYIGVDVNRIATPDIVGGFPAENGQFPYQISLRENGAHSCGGSIVNQRSILTAAHCIYNVPTNILTVVVGSNRLSVGGASFAVIRAIYHPLFNPNTLINDVAVVTTLSLITYNQFVRPISLSQFPTVPGSTLTLSGWGLTSFPGIIPDNLQFINLQSISLAQCTTQNRAGLPVTVGNICTLSPANQGACKGDSGGPLVNQNSVQVGIVSYGLPCARGVPDVFTSVSFFLPWISYYI